MLFSAIDEFSYFIEIFALFRTNHCKFWIIYLDLIKTQIICCTLQKNSQISQSSTEIVYVELQIIWLNKLSGSSHDIQIIAMTWFSSLTESNDRPMISPNDDISTEY
ncbi:MAG: hypothetical protein CL398_02245 [Acidiferrobacteraceae bacterium]|nr:hypothetical protein [Acidiferrobacteraceae bacterium]